MAIAGKRQEGGGTWEGRDILERREGSTHRLYMSETMSISASAWAIFCSEEIWGRPPMPKKDILMVRNVGSVFGRCDLVGGGG
jgi:hypothetical protein